MKDKSYSPEEIQEKFDSLPEDIKAAVFGSDMLGLLQKVGQTHKLHIDQLDVLEAEVADVMTGFSKPEDFVTNLSQSLSIDRPQAESIAKEINDGLFLKIRESLKKLYASPGTAPAIAAPAPVVPAPKPTDTQKPVSPAPAPQVPMKTPEMHPADLMLGQKTVSVAPSSAPAATKPTPGAPTSAEIKPQPYKADPYREPIQ